MNKTWVVGVSCVVLSTVFIVAGVLKLMDLQGFADSLFGYQFLPKELIHPVAIGLPVFEVVIGALLLIPVNNFKRISATAVIGLNLLFIILLIVTYARGLSVQCGCFGKMTLLPVKWQLQEVVVRDMVLLVLGLIVYRKSFVKGRESGDE